MHFFCLSLLFFISKTTLFLSHWKIMLTLIFVIFSVKVFCNDASASALVEIVLMTEILFLSFWLLRLSSLAFFYRT